MLYEKTRYKQYEIDSMIRGVYVQSNMMQEMTLFDGTYYIFPFASPLSRLITYGCVMGILIPTQLSLPLVLDSIYIPGVFYQDNTGTSL